MSIPGKITPTGLVLPDDLEYDNWIQVGETLKLIESGVQWWIGDWLAFGERKYGEMYSQALDSTEYEYQSLADMVYVATNVGFSRRRENLSWSHHREVAALEPEQQTLILDSAVNEGLSHKQLRQEVRALKVPQAPAPVPAGTYSILYADPPWRYDFEASNSREIENQYPTLDLEDIKYPKDFPKTTGDAVLFLWATSPKLTEAMQVMGAWGFEYRTCMVWVKNKIGMGYYARQRHELLLIGRKGEPKPPEPADRPDSVIEAPRLDHSAKPPEVYNIIERMFPDRKRIELYARNKRDGWDSWGLEV